MIHSFGAENYQSFKEGFDVSLELNAKVPKLISQGKKTSTILGIKGANASGKTNILRSLFFAAHFATTSFKEDPNEEISVKGFFRKNKKNSSFYIDFTSNSIRYLYELEVTRESVIRESIYKKIARKTLILERKHNEITYKTSDFLSLDLITLRSNASIIDTALHYKLKGISEDLKNIHDFLYSINGNLGESGVYDEKRLYDYNSVSKYYHDIPEAFEFAKKIIANSDLGINNIVIHSREDDEGKKVFFPIFHHDSDYHTSDADWLTYWEESDGTTALYRRLFRYWATLFGGGVLVMDEFDTNYHPDLLPQILDLFINEETNPNNAQFIFTSHNLQIMDYLGKYRTYLVAKENGESYCYRLDEIPGDIIKSGDVIRNDRSISNLYRDGKLGGVPKI